jgi:hypothetical protein
MIRFRFQVYLGAQHPCLSFPATSRTFGSLLRSIRLYSHNIPETRDAAPNTSSLSIHILRTVESPTFPLYTPTPLKPNISARSISPCGYDPPVYSVRVSPDAPSTLPSGRSVVGSIRQSRPSVYGTGILDKIQDGTCIRKSYDLTFYTYSSCTSLSLGAPFREVQVIYFLQPCQW